MKKTTLLAVLILVLVAVRSADSGSRNAVDTNRNTIVRFTAAYENIIGGFFTCSGKRISGNGPRSFTKDSEQCTITDLSSFPPGTYRGAPNYIVNGVRYGWFSDYDGVTAVGVNLIVTDNGDGTGHLDVDTYY